MKRDVGFTISRDAYILLCRFWLLISRLTYLCFGTLLNQGEEFSLQVCWDYVNGNVTWTQQSVLLLRCIGLVIRSFGLVYSISRYPRA